MDGEGYRGHSHRAGETQTAGSLNLSTNQQETKKCPSLCLFVFQNKRKPILLCVFYCTYLHTNQREEQQSGVHVAVIQYELPVVERKH